MPLIIKFYAEGFYDTNYWNVCDGYTSTTFCIVCDGFVCLSYTTDLYTSNYWIVVD